MNPVLLTNLLDKSKMYAKSKHHESVYMLHVFCSLVDNEIVRRLLDKCSCNFQILSSMVNEDMMNLDVVRANMPIDFSEDVIQLKNLSMKKAELGGNTSVELYNVLEAFLEFENSDVVYILKSSGFSVSNFKKILKENKRAYSQFTINLDDMGVKEQQMNGQEVHNQSHSSKKNKNNPEEAIKELKWVVNLNEHVKKSFIDPMIGREKEVNDLVHTLAKKKKSNAILVGEAGVGKTAIVEGFAKLINEKQVPEEIKTYKVFSLDINGLMSQTAYRGQFESKVQETVEILKKIPNSVLFIDEIHMVMGANASGDGSMSLANVLKPLMTSGELKFIGATTYKEYANHFEKDAALTRRFQKIDIDEPTAEDCVKILNGLKESYEKFHKVKLMSESLEAAVNLSVKFLKNKFLPDKAIDVIDEACTMVKFNKEQYSGIVSPKEIRKIISKIAKIPEESLTEDVKKKVQSLSSELNKVIFGQEQAISKIEETILLSKSGLNNENKPLGSFMFAGPTGVGKTELTNQLTKLMNMNLTRIDMSEYQEEHTVSKLIGAPPGYVGYDQEGLLTSAVNKNPNSVILLDEIEKAHPKALDILLQILDYGTLSDSKGKKADFRQSVIVCTTNTGTEELTKSVIGMTTESIKSQRDPLEVVKKSFRPEFINRFDNIIWFNSLSKENVKSVLLKLTSQLDASLVSKNIKITLSPEAQEFIINKGYSPQYGARPMERVFMQEIKVPLSKEIIYGKLQNGGTVSVLIEENKVIFQVKPLKAKKVKGKNGITV